MCFDSSNRLTYASKNSYTYNAEDTRIRLKESDGTVTEYTYNTNCKLSQLLQKTTNGTTTKYVYGHGLIGEAKGSEFKTYHFDYRGSTVALTDANGDITDTFEYDTYGLMTNHQGTSNIIFGYNGRDGVITDNNGLLYMRARYYFPQLKRFINADILHGEISDSTSLNRYSYVNGNPVSYVDPFGLSKERGGAVIKPVYELSNQQYNQILNSKLPSRYMPNRKGFGNITTMDTSNIQFFTSQKYVEKGFLTSEHWEFNTYLYITLPVSEWTKCIETTDIYDKNMGDFVGFLLDLGIGTIGEIYGLQGGEGVSEVYDLANEWADSEFSNVVLDDFGRYISNSISGKNSTEEVSLLLYAYCWEYKKDNSNNEWNTSYIGYAYPWDKMAYIFE